MLSLLCARALQAGIETDYVRSLVRKHHLKPDDNSVESEQWPWPVRIYTMGSFQIVREDIPLEFPGKTPQKPLELLKVLIAFGGQNVPEERLTDALWPDADGDLAYQSLEITVRRLRHLLGEDICLRYGARSLSVDRRQCWVDSLALENIVKRSGSISADRVAPKYREAAGLYRGHFLPSDSGCEWAVSRSETLQSMMLRLIEEAGRHDEGQGEWENAAACYQKGLDVDCLAEDLYRRLMICYQKLGRRAEAIRLYQRCCSVLQTHLGIRPSPETEAVYASLHQ